MDKLRPFLARFFKANIAASGLEIVEVGATGDFAVGLGRREPHFEVVAFSCAETEVAAA